MGIFLRQSYNIKPLRWGSPADIEYAIKVNAEKVFDVDPDSIVLAMPLFWGLPCLDYSGKRNDGVNSGAYHRDEGLEFGSLTNWNYVSVTDDTTLDIVDKISINVRIRPASVAGWVGLVCKNTMAVHGAYHFVINPTGYLSGGVKDVVNFQTVQSTTHQLQIDRQQTVAMTFDLSADILDLYSGGIKIKTDASFTYSIVGNNQPIMIGRGAAAAESFIGFIDFVEIANIAFTADQIALFHDLPYGLYQSVSRPIWLIPAAPYSTGKICGVTNPAKINGIAVANVAKMNGIVWENV